MLVSGPWGRGWVSWLLRPSRIPKAKTCFVPWDVWWWKVWGERPNPRPFYNRWPAGHWANVAVAAKSGRRLIGAETHHRTRTLSKAPSIDRLVDNHETCWQWWRLLTMRIVILDNFKTVLTTIRSLFHIWGTVGRGPFNLFTLIQVCKS